MTKQWLYGRCDQYGGMVGPAGSNLQPIGYEPTALTIVQAPAESFLGTSSGHDHFLRDYGAKGKAGPSCRRQRIVHIVSRSAARFKGTSRMMSE